MPRRACDGTGLLEAFRAAVANLEAHVDEINALNVYPVPDGDTGSNMLATVRAALAEAETVASQRADRIAAAISFGALMGARGNSGVITSQIFRGMADALGGKARFNGLDLAHALSEGARTAYGAVARPVEGTILTVIRESAAAAVVVAERDADVESVLGGTVEAAQHSVAKTPSLLAILREAGVVDSGGQGIYRLFQGAHLHLAGRGRTGQARGSAKVAAGRSKAAAGPLKAAAGPSVTTLVANADDGFGYETMFLLQPNGAGSLDIDAIRDRLESIGQSVLVAGDARALKVHVHNERPDLVIGYGLSVGTLSRISIENLDHQARDVRELRAATFTGGVEPEAPGFDGSGVAAVQVEAAATLPAPVPALGVLAVAAGDGLAAIFREFGVAGLVDGGQSANPSTAELLAAIARLEAREIVILPNNPNVVLAARQAAGLSQRPVAVIPTRNAAEGIAALLALDPQLDAAANTQPMTEAARAIQSLVITEAVRDATIGGRKVKRGQTIALDPDDGLVAVNTNRENCALAAVTSLQPGFELLTLFYGDGADLAEAEGMARRIGLVLPAIDIEVRHGGQPFYRYLIAVE